MAMTDGTSMAASTDMPGAPRTLTGARIHSLRRDARMTQAELAHRLGSTESAIARMEAGQQRVSEATMRRIVKALGYDVD